MTDDQKADWLFKQIDWRAEVKRRSNSNALHFFLLSYDQKIDFMNNTVFPLYEQAGSPEPYTKECDLFVFEFFNK